MARLNRLQRGGLGPLHPRQAAWRERMAAPVVGRKQRRGPVGCYECCRQRGSRRDLWEKLCTKCRRLTRAAVCCGYVTVVMNPRIRVPRLTSGGRWKQFLKRYPHFRFREELKYVPPVDDGGDGEVAAAP